MQEHNKTTRPTINKYFVNLTKLVAQRSTCLRRQVGCVLVNSKNQILATGYNGAPAGKPHCESLPCVRMTKGLEYCMAVHAEQNALLQCNNVDEIHTAYITHSPCVTCVKMLLNTGCKNIIFIEPYDSQDNQARDLWTTDMLHSWRQARD